MATARLLKQTFRPINLYRLAWAYGLSDLALLFFETNRVHGPSMAPTLSPAFHSTGAKDWVLVSKYRARDTLARGDVVVYWKPHDPERIGVKRVVALGGDVVWRDVRRVSAEEQKRRQGVVTNAARDGFADLGPLVRVPAGKVWVEGDNWRESLDSNDYGPVPRNLIIGKAKWIVWPFARWGAVPPVKAGDGNYPRTKVRPGKAVLPPEWEEI